MCGEELRESRHRRPADVGGGVVVNVHRVDGVRDP
jgi:hypothetical protein